MKIFSRFLLFISIAIIGFSLFANFFGFDRDNNWGIGRILLLSIGTILLFIGLLIISWKIWVKVYIQFDEGRIKIIKVILEIPIIHRFSIWVSYRLKKFENHAAVRWYNRSMVTPVKHSRIAAYFGGSNYRKAALAAGVVACIVITIFIWFVSVGQWTKWPSTGDYYYELARAFWHGQLNLLIKPDPELLALSDPYDYESRAHISHPWDVSLFNGKFYLYWGPAPAIILAIVRIFYTARIGDEILVFSFLSGAFIFASLLILQFHKRLFPELRWWSVVPGILMAGLVNPLPWILNRPGIYEAAIAGGQFFLIAGLFFGFLAIETEKHRSIFLIIACSSWALAIGSRVNLAIVVIFLIGMVALYLLHNSVKYKDKLYSILAISIPFAIGLIGLGLYNKLRFGSWFDVGNRYQLGGQNILPNLHNYLLNPFRTLSVFPYIKPNWGGKYIFFPINTPLYYYSEQITGLLPSAPYVVLAVIPVIFIIWKCWQYKKENGAELLSNQSYFSERILIWMSVSLTGAVLMVFSTTLLLLWGTMRYMADMVILATLTSTMGFFIGLTFLKNHNGWRKLFILFALMITVASIIISLLLAITGYDSRFEKLNPLLFEFLTRLLTP
jgi:hypothetical protein